MSSDALDFSRMTKSQLIEMLMDGDRAAAAMDAMQPSLLPDGPGRVFVEAASDQVMVNFREQQAVVAQLDALAGNDREGRSGVIRRAVAEYLDRHARNGDVADAA